MGLQLAQFAVSLGAILFIAWLVGRMGLGGDTRIKDEAHARQLADEADCGFTPNDVILDRSRTGALLRDDRGRIMLLRRHGSHFVARMLDDHAHVRLDQNLLTLATSERTFGEITLDLGEAAQEWAASLRRLEV